MRKTAGVVLVKGKEVLVLWKKDSGKPDFPKGGIRKRETARETAVREAEEETGLAITPLPDFIHRFEFKRGHHYKYTFFLARVTGTVRISREHTGYLWLPIPTAREVFSRKNIATMLDAVESYLQR